VSGFLNGLAGGINEGAAVVSGASSVVNTVGNLAGALGALASGNPFSVGYGAAIGGLGPWSARLQPASWRGCEFAVREAPIKVGRRIVLHEYPYRDDPWPEDMGRASRMCRFSGFIVGDDVFDQRDAMKTAAEQKGSGTLVHPSLGSATATLLDFTATERADLGRAVELEFTFVISGQTQPIFPSTAAST
jgi:prophage DNA circulation protein